MAGNVERLIGVTGELERTREVNGERAISLKVLLSPQNALVFDMLETESVIELEDDGQYYRIKNVTKTSKGKGIQKDIKAQHVFFDLIDDKIRREDQRTGSFSVDSMLSFVLAPAGWQFEILSGKYYAEQFENFGGDNCLKLFTELVDRYHFEYIPDSRTKKVYVYGQIGETTDAQIRYNHNLKTIKVTINTDNLSTIGTAYGKQTTDEEGNVLSQVTGTYRHPNADIFGERWAEDWEDKRFTTVASLQAEIERRLITDPEFSVEVEYIELKKEGNLIHNFNLGDDVFVLHEIWNLDLLARVLKIVDYPLSRVKQPKISISNLRSNLKDRMASTTRRSIEAQKNALSAQNKATLAELKANAASGEAGAQKARLDNILDENGNMTTQSRKLYMNSFVYADAQGLWAVNPTDPSKYVFLGSGGLDIQRGMMRLEGEAGTVIIDGTSQMHKILATGIINFRIEAGKVSDSQSVYHGLGYVPAFSAYMQGDDTVPEENGVSYVLPRLITGNDPAGLDILSFVRGEATSTRFYVRLHRATNYAVGLPEKIIKIRYFIYKEEAF